MAEPGRAYRALLIGNSEFPGDPGLLRTLLGPPTDVPLLAAALTDPDTGLHRADAVRTVLEEDAQHIRDVLEEFFDSALAHEQLFLYYSGHGLLDLRNRLRLCARDTTAGRLQSRAVGLEFVDGLIEGCAARSIVVILDCCFSGAAAVKGQDPAAQLAGHGRFVMTSSSHGDTSADAETAGTASPFTRQLVAGLRTGAPGRDGLVTAYDIYRYVHGRLRSSGQVPHMKTEGGVGAIPLARRPPRPAADAAGDQAGDQAGAGDGTALLDVRPVFTTVDGRQDRLATYTDFSGVLYVRLPWRNALLTTHREDIAAAGEHTPVVAELYRYADVTWRDIHARASGRKEAELRADTSGGGVSFTLPDELGTVEWQEPQVRAFGRASAQGRWPGTPRAQSPTPEEYRADSGYRRLRASARRGLLWSVALIPETLANNALDGLAWYERVGGGALTLTMVVSVVLALWYLRNAWRFLRIRGMLRSSGLYAIPMVMETGMVAEDVADGFSVTTVHKPWAWLRYESTSLEPLRTRDELGRAPHQEEATEWPALAVLLQSFHGQDITRRAKGADAPDGSAIEHVKVIGTPRPGRWVVIHTANGMLWPRAKAR
ncbi:caspase domain-containing protein [Streptomyces sp. NPDC056161]|uniref:caspase family protein n=1 Tax=Streptomyces sp. NPDC056161 TaxID=3345732 RepID=UPI0035E0BCCB